MVAGEHHVRAGEHSHTRSPCLSLTHTSLFPSLSNSLSHTLSYTLLHSLAHTHTLTLSHTLFLSRTLPLPLSRIGEHDLHAGEHSHTRPLCLSHTQEPGTLNPEP